MRTADSGLCTFDWGGTRTLDLLQGQYHKPPRCQEIKWRRRRWPTSENILCQTKALTLRPAFSWKAITNLTVLGSAYYL
jgi:hypothetical protein